MCTFKLLLAEVIIDIVLFAMRLPVYPLQQCIDSLPKLQEILICQLEIWVYNELKMCYDPKPIPGALFI